MKHLSYLDEVDSPESLKFAKDNSDKTIEALKKEPIFETIQTELRNIFTASDRIAHGDRIEQHMYNLWTDATNERGLWRRTSLGSYATENPIWEVILDLDKLCVDESTDWVWAGASLLPPHYNKALISLSPGGSDATVTREFDIDKKEFVKDGFFIPEAKTDATWVNENLLLVSTDFGPDSLTESGYAREVRTLKRGDSLDQAELLYQGQKTDLMISSMYLKKENKTFITRAISFYESETFLLENGELILIPMPKDAEFSGLFENQLIYSLKSELNGFPSGTEVSVSLSSIKDPNFISQLVPIFIPSKTCFLSALTMTKNYLILDLLDNVQGKMLKVSRKNDQWVIETFLDMPETIVSVTDVSDEDDLIHLTLSSFTTPSSLYQMDISVDKEPTILKKAKERFDSSNIKAEQLWAKSLDGTMIPYFLVSKKDLVLDGRNPTLLEGYGGFQVNMEPGYSGVTGKAWLEKGGVYVMANIRGGGEFGPQWHQAALRENRNKSFEDFIAIGEDLIKRQITSPKHLGIKGGSNGGLLVGAVATMRPDLFNAVLCEVPLLDMLNYHTLLAGASWMDEYGDPTEPEMRKFLESYSPLHNLKKDKTYPEIFFLTSTKDDRVHPSHARKMFSLMTEMHKPALYFENSQGGHNGTADVEQDVLWYSMEFTYLWKKLS